MMLSQPTTIEREVHIAASAETIFSFFVDPVKLTRWKGIHADIDPRPGGQYRLNINGQDVAAGHYIAVEPPNRIVFTWGWEGNADLPPGASTVEITLHAHEGGTNVRLAHTGLEPAQFLFQSQGWDYYLPRLVTAVQAQEAT